MECSNENCCLGCLKITKECNYERYHFKSESLKSILQTETLPLCYICKRIAQYTEMFIQNVQSNQILLANFHGDLSSSMHMISTQLQPLKTLTHTQTNTFHLPLVSDGESFIIIHSSNVMKIEPKDEDFNESDKEDDNSESIVKGEDDVSLKGLLKEELELDDVSLSELKKELNKQNMFIEKPENHRKVKIKDCKKEKQKIKLIKITKEECLEERKEREKEKNYLNCIFKCTDCIKGFTFKASFDKHMERHSYITGNYECDICKIRMDSKRKLIIHMNCHYNRYKCIECGLVRISRLSIQEHYSLVHGYNQEYSCTQCKKKFTRKSALKKHKLYSHTNTGRVTCEFCNKTYVTKEVLKSHMIVMHSSEVSAEEVCRRNVCEECGMRFKTPSQLKNHSVKHSGNRDYYCVECDKSFKTVAILKHHLKTASPHINYLELPYGCAHCDKKFAIKRDVVRHMNRVHLNVKPYSCDKCDKAYVNLWSLTEHKRYSHEGFKRPLKYPCPMCDKIFDRNSILKEHIRTHTGERPFRCTCGAAFTQRSALRTHRRLVHLRLTRDGRPKHTHNTQGS